MNWIQNNTEFRRRFPPSDRYLIGVSGGRDSVALLHLLVEAGYKQLIVCHFDHQLRGRSSSADAAFVKQLAGRFQLEAELESKNVRALAGKRKLSIETAAREARYSFFVAAAKGHRCRTIFLGHHADDLVETFLWNLFRGAGLTGLSAMRETSTRRDKNFDLVVVRPLLGVWRAEIDKYVRHHRLKFREDASNKKLSATRNKIRHRILPVLEKAIGRNIRQSIWRTAAIAAEEENFFEKLLPDTLPGSIELEPLREMSPALQRRVLHKWLRTGQVTDVGFDLVERVRALIDPINRVAKVNLPKNRYARRRAKKIFIED